MELKGEVNAAKQNMFKSVEILLYAEEQIKNVETTCQSQAPPQSEPTSVTK